MRTKNNQGFTLVELMVSVAIASIILSLAAPSFRNLLSNNRLISQTNEFVASTMVARSEAVKRRVPIVLSSISNTSDWKQGWQVWPDANRNNVQDADEVPLQRVDALSGTTTFVSSGGVATFTYSSDGRVNTTATLDLCDDRTGETGRRITIGPSGRASAADLNCS